MELISNSEFKRKAEAHSSWLADRESYPKLRFIMKGAYIRGVEIKGVNLSECDFSKCHFHDCKFTECLFNDASLTSNVFTSCSFSRCGLCGADFSSSDIRGTDFSGSNMAGCTIDGCMFDGINLSGCNLRNMCFPLMADECDVKFDKRSIYKLLCQTVNAGLNSDVDDDFKGMLSNISDTIKTVDL